jgi:hypothetical protein
VDLNRQFVSEMTENNPIIIPDELPFPTDESAKNDDKIAVDDVDDITDGQPEASDVPLDAAVPTPVTASPSTGPAPKTRGRKKGKPDPKNRPSTLLERPVMNPIWLSVSEAAKIGGVTGKTIRRAIQAAEITYKIVNDRYLVSIASLVTFLHTTTKLKNKLNQIGIGQYIRSWRE